MTDNEIYRELDIEFDRVLNYIDNIEHRYRRTILKSKTFPMSFEPKVYISPKKNRFYILFEAKNKKSRKNLYKTVICVYDNGRGLNVAMYCGNPLEHITIYSSHFFSRYRSRFLKNKDLSTMDVILHFFRNNPNSFGEVTDDDGKMVLTCNDGVMFCKIGNNGKVIVCKTFVSFDMLYDTQSRYKGEFKELLKEYEMKRYKFIS